MRTLGESSNGSALTIARSDRGVSIGTVLSELGSGRPLTVNGALVARGFEENNERLFHALSSIGKRPPVWRRRVVIPEQGPLGRVTVAVDWECDPEHLGEAARVVESSFRAATEEQLAAALYRLRTVTRSRDGRADADVVAETGIWIESLKGFPGDAVLEAIRAWPLRPGRGQFLPSLSELLDDVRVLIEPRVALANHVAALVIARQRETPPAAAAAALPRPPEEDRASLVDRLWTNGVRKVLSPREDALARSRDPVALEAPTVIGEGLRAKLDERRPRQEGE